MLQVLRYFTVAMRGAGEKLPGIATGRELAWNLPPHLTELPPSPSHRDIPGALTLPWDYFANSFLSGFDCLEGKIGSWFFGGFLFLSMELCSQGHGPFPKRERKGEVWGQASPPDRQVCPFRREPCAACGHF